MGLDRVVVHDVNYDVGSHCNIHYRPEAAMELAAVESDIHPLVSHYNDEKSRVRSVGGMTCAANHPKPEQMKRVSGSEKTCKNNYYDQDRQN